MKLRILNAIALIAIGMIPMTLTGCGDEGATMVKPEGTAEDIQAASEEAAAAAENRPPS
ncbi:hypothetical protein Q31b_39510 [Novipirellula aureliae]|uniref:Uncharacterized protein n=1 Tax=Novipirellula aureliae TaxID=2527966 RepID=A0A5C6DNK4_9BACT|nr:hypothetical protein [Novipirellula aureliae]TWU38873.1 hypothetical protein Q31b_39510 [Novipirellula aureliae]